MVTKVNRPIKYKNVLAVVSLGLLIIIFFTISFSGHSKALSVATNGTTSTPNNGENTSNCGGSAPPGNPQLIACQTESIDNITYYEVGEVNPDPSKGTSAIPKPVTLNVNYTCATGFEGFRIRSIPGEGNLSLGGGQTNANYANDCNGYALSNSPVLNPAPTKTEGQPGGTITITPPNCDQYNGALCEAFFQVIAVNPNSPNPATSGDNPDNSAGFYGGNIIVGFSLASTNIQADIVPAFNKQSSLNPAQYSTASTLSFDGYSVTTHTWPSFANPAGLYGNTSITFQVPYGYSGSPYLAWENADSNIGGSGTISWTLNDTTDNGSKQIASESGSQIGPTSTSYPISAQSANKLYYFQLSNLKACHNYTWTWSGIGKGDPIDVSVPFDIAPPNHQLTCWDLAGHSKVSSSGLTYAFNHEVGTEGYYTANYNWNVQGCYYTNNNKGYCDSSLTSSRWSSSCSASSPENIVINAGAADCSSSSNSLPSGSPTCPPGSYDTYNYCPSYGYRQLALNNYSFPSNAYPGDGYCQRIYFDNSDGTDTAPGASSPACVSFSGSTAPSAAFSCTSATFKTALSYSVSFPNPSVTPSPSYKQETGISYALYLSNGSSGTVPKLSSGQFIPGEPGDSGDDVATNKSIYGNNETYSVYNDTSLNPSGNPSGWPPIPGGYVNEANNQSLNKQITYNLTTSQLMSGSLTWYLVLFNHVGIERVPTDPGHFAAYNSDTIYVQSVTAEPSINCFQATCSITANGTLGNNDTEVGQPFNFYVTVTNTGSSDSSDVLYDPYPGTNDQLVITPSYYTGSSPSESDVGQNIAPGRTSTPLTFSATAGSDTNTHLISATVGYPNIPGLEDIGSCNSPTNGAFNMVNYAKFNLVPTAVICTNNCNTEDPTSVNYSTYVLSNAPETTNANVSVPANTTSSVYYIAYPGTTPTRYFIGPNGPVYENNDFSSSSNPPPAGSSNYTIQPGTLTPPQPFTAGDQYCSSVEITSASQGYVTSSGNIIDGSNYNNTSTKCFTIHNEPYVQFFGNDVIGNSAFNTSSTSCNNNTNPSGIYAFSQATSGSTNTAKGSYSQFGAEALGDILGFGTAALRNPSPSPPANPATGLTFSNTTTGNGNGSDAAYLGGQVGFSECASTPNYNNDELPGAQTYTTNMAINNTTPQDYNLTPTSGNTATINTSTLTINPGVKAAIFVNGNAYIGANIQYAGANSGWSFNNIPSLWVIATGNIYIAPNVTRLDGVYVAQPNPSSTSGPSGLINTCASSNGPYQLSYLYGNSTTNPSSGCDQQLTINGAFIDQASILDRSYSSVRYSAPPENPQSTPSHNCGTPNKDVNPTQTSEPTCAAEVFNFSPEVYLSQPALKPYTGVYEYITSLSPTL